MYICDIVNMGDPANGSCNRNKIPVDYPKKTTVSSRRPMWTLVSSSTSRPGSKNWSGKRVLVEQRQPLPNC